MTHQHIDINALFEQHYDFIAERVMPIIVNHAAKEGHDPDTLMLVAICGLAHVLDEVTPFDARITAAAILAVCGKDEPMDPRETLQ